MDARTCARAFVQIDAVPVKKEREGAVDDVSLDEGAWLAPEHVDAAQVAEVIVAHVVDQVANDALAGPRARRKAPHPPDGQPHVVEVGDLVARDGDAVRVLHGSRKRGKRKRCTGRLSVDTTAGVCVCGVCCVLCGVSGGSRGL